MSSAAVVIGALIVKTTNWWSTLANIYTNLRVAECLYHLACFKVRTNQLIYYLFKHVGCLFITKEH